MKLYLPFAAIALAAGILFANPASSQGLNLLWSKCYGGTGADFANRIISTSDSGAILVGSSGLANGDITAFKGQTDLCVMKIDKGGSKQWIRSIGGTLADQGRGIAVNPDGSSFVASYSASTDGDVTGNHGNYDMWIVQLSPTGSLVWQKSLGGSNDDEAWGVAGTQDGGCIAIGVTNSTDGDVVGKHGSTDVWVVKLASDGNVEWKKCYGGSGADKGFAVKQTPDGGYLFAASTFSNDGDVTGNHGDADVWLVKIDATGNIIWESAFGGSAYDSPFDMLLAPDGNIFVAGGTRSNNGDLPATSPAGNNAFIAKVSPTGNLIWMDAYGGSDFDDAYSLAVAANGDIIVAGTTKSTDGVINKQHSLYDGWIFRVDAASHQLKWSNTFGGSRDDMPGGIALSQNGTVFIGGYTNSSDFDAVTNHNGPSPNGVYDMWIMNLSGGVGIGTAPVPGGDLLVYPTVAGDRISVVIGSQPGQSIVQIVDMGGKVVREQRTIQAKVEIDISALGAGSYKVAVRNGTAYLASGFIKK